MHTETRSVHEHSGEKAQTHHFRFHGPSSASTIVQTGCEVCYGIPVSLIGPILSGCKNDVFQKNKKSKSERLRLCDVLILTFVFLETEQRGRKSKFKELATSRKLSSVLSTDHSPILIWKTDFSPPDEVRPGFELSSMTHKI